MPFSNHIQEVYAVPARFFLQLHHTYGGWQNVSPKWHTSKADAEKMLYFLRFSDPEGEYRIKEEP